MLAIYANIIGGIAIVLWCSSIQAKNKSTILVFQLIADMLYGIQYLMLGSLSTFVMHLISCVKTLIIYLEEKRGRRMSLLLVAVFVIITITMGIINYEGLMGLIPVAITLVYIYSTWQTKTSVIRWTMLITAIAWVIYNNYVGAYVSMFGAFGEILSSIIAIIRYDVLKRGENVNDTKEN